MDPKKIGRGKLIARFLSIVVPLAILAFLCLKYLVVLKDLVPFFLAMVALPSIVSLIYFYTWTWGRDENTSNKS